VPLIEANRKHRANSALLGKRGWGKAKAAYDMRLYYHPVKETGRKNPVEESVTAA